MKKTHNYIILLLTCANLALPANIYAENENIKDDNIYEYETEDQEGMGLEEFYKLPIINETKIVDEDINTKMSEKALRSANTRGDYAPMVVCGENQAAYL